MKNHKKSKEDYVENYRENYKENYMGDGDDGGVAVKTIMGIFWGLVTFIAIYYSFIIEGGFSLGPFLLALFFSPIYLVWGVYKAGVPPKIKINH